MLLVHGYTGSYDKVSRRVATYLRSLEARRAPKPLYGDWSPEPEVEGAVPPPSDQAIQILRRRGYLTEMSVEEEETFFEAVAVRLHERSVRWFPSYMVMPTYDCNLRCAYCFQDHMRTDSRFRHLLRVMTTEVADRIFTSMPEIEALHGHQSPEPPERSLGFFGGEPLLEACRPIVGYIVDKALDMGPFTFWAVTNGTDLEAYRDLLTPGKISRLQITLDGPAVDHDQRRIYADGSGSYEKITRNISMALDLGVRVDLRLNVDRTNIGQLPGLAEEFLARGWSGHPGFGAYAAPIRAENENTDRKTIFDTWELDQTLAGMAEQDTGMKRILRPDGGIRNQALRILQSSEEAGPNFRESYCSAHTGLYIFDIFADIYACWDRTGDPTVRIGHLEDDGRVVLNAPVNAFWKGRTVASNPVCRRCRYALHCGGGCAVLAYGKTGNYYSNYCDGYASRFRARVAEAFLDHLSGSELVAGFESICNE